MSMKPGELIVTGRNGAAYLANAQESADSWNELDDRDRAKLEQRMRLLCTADGPVDNTKFRPIRGGPKGIFEIKIKTPDLGAYTFKEGNDYRITHVARRPHNKRTVAEAERADRIRAEHERNQSRHAQKNRPD